ncbi:protein tramtrack, alpha isoform isoform X1 [Drosophila persimilis]|uniref:protein tramtrack, alpha isoform isoform X1 n=1 Tax=Drosophila persimilis TaxID=7234 RepID=UPI000F079AA3|nr:protein tramtrack, alpha isoform isoform X1 [Drosophila persimilis]XP_026840357.1 protein tramtrack, alpha isoform isoform X1 [Drosophila persimilis]
MKMASQRFCLRWNNHQSNLLSVFDQLLHAETFTDVTLAVEGQYLKAHKMVLSACSPYFNALFINHPEKHPIVILKDVPYSDMKSLLDFMYRGEVSVDQERLTAFLRVAESLRIKGLTEVNDDKPSPAESTPAAAAPPQLQRIQPYLVPQRNRSQASLLASTASAANSATLPVQPSLLSSALMPKRKRGRPRKLSGSSNGTGNDYEDFERDNLMNDSDMGNGKLGNDSYSGNDDGSDDNQQESGNNDDLNESRDSLPTKRSKNSKDHRVVNQAEDNSTSVTAAQSQATPELSQRLFGSTSTLTTTISAKTTTSAGTGSGLGAATATTSAAEPTVATLLEVGNNPVHLPTILGLKIRAINPNTTSPQKQSQAQPPSPTQSQSKTKPKGSGNGNSNSNSLLKQQLRGGAKDPEVPRLPAAAAAAAPSPIEETDIESQEEAHATACSGLQSLANAAEQQAAQVANSSGNLHHQILMHMAANQQKAADYYQQQQQQQQQQASPLSADQYPDDDMELLCMADQQDKADEPDHELLTLADENAGLPGYQATDSEPTAVSDKSPAASGGVRASNPTRLSGSKKPAKRPIQRRRVRRKAQSTIDDQAEHLTEMSVRGLDLFRYASVVEGVYRCTECAKENMQKTFKNKYSFQRHAFLYHEGKHRKVFPCPVCCKEFSRPDKMKNHLKMTHENFTPPKDMSAFSPLKYLITAAAAGEMQASMYQQQQQQQQEQEHYQRQLEQQMERIEQQQMEQQDSCLLLPEDVKQEDQELSDGYEASNPEAVAAAMLSLQHDVIIKNEIQISPSPTPSPSPSPPTTCAVAEGKSLALATTAQTTAT